MKTIVFWTVILAGCAVLVIFPGFVYGVVFFVIVGIVVYNIYHGWTEQSSRRLAESFVIGTIAGDRSRGKTL